MGLLEISRLSWWCTRNVQPYCITVILVLCFFFCFFFAPPASFVGFIIGTCYCVTDKELINLPWFLAPFAPEWMFAVSSRNLQHLFPTRTLPRRHVLFWNPTMDLTSWLGSPNWLWNVLLVCASVFHILFYISGCNKEFIYLILSCPNWRPMLCLLQGILTMLSLFRVFWQK